MDWYYARNGQHQGPLSEEQLRQMVASGQVVATDVVWKTGMQAWVPAHQAFPPGLPAGAPPPPPAVSSPPAHSQPVYAQQASAPQQQAYSQASAQPPRQRIAYILLGVFLGTLGIYNFYAGYTGRAVAQLLITIFIGWLIVPWLGVWIWNLVEIITVTADAQGKQMV
jgi:TM2 domain-containing membrane protein YozV